MFVFACFLSFLIGYTTRLELDPVAQTHFTPLAEALARSVDALVLAHQFPITLQDIVLELIRSFPGVELPSEEIVLHCLSCMIGSGILNYDPTSESYTPSTKHHLFENSEHQQPE